MDTISQTNKITKSLMQPDNPAKLLLVVTLVSVIFGIITGFILSGKNKTGLTSAGLTLTPAKNAQSDTKTFKDFAEGVIKVRPESKDPGEYTEGTHTLVRQGSVPVALTSSVVDLSQYDGKKVKVFGETQKALKEGWLMDVGKVEEIK